MVRTVFQRNARLRKRRERTLTGSLSVSSGGGGVSFSSSSPGGGSSSGDDSDAAAKVEVDYASAYHSKTRSERKSDGWTHFPKPPVDATATRHAPPAPVHLVPAGRVILMAATWLVFGLATPPV